MAGNIAGVTNLSSLSLDGNLSMSTSSTVPGGVANLSVGTVVFGPAQLSSRTIVAASLSSIGPTNPDNGVWGFQLLASGMSLIYRSGNSLYYFNSAASGAAP